MSGTSEESALMKLHPKFASVVERNGARMNLVPTKSTLFRWNKKIVAPGPNTLKFRVVT
jgi:hypothetical protein